MEQVQVELLAPAGDWACMEAAVANGADAVFFGVGKWNARVRASNFAMEELPEIMRFLHRYGVKGFVTLNILIFENELADVRELLNACIDAGVDAMIIQDLGLVQLIRAMSPDFPIHGSTQMTITSPEAVEFTKPFNIERVVLGRENSLKQIRQIGEQAKLPMEVFVHGALCVSYSGQCLTSEMWGGRSANRGECAQACRLPYDLMVDGEHKPMGDVAYLLSPKDLAAIELVPELIEAGVASFKIEGRLKSPEYVANVVSKYREAIDAYMRREPYTLTEEKRRELQQSFSRGFTVGFLKGTNNKQLVDGTFPKSRGVFLGRIEAVLPYGVQLTLEAPLKRGDGVVFDQGDPTQKEQGGRVYELFADGKLLEDGLEKGRVEVRFGRNNIKLSQVNIGDKLWKTNDPHLDARLRETFEHGEPFRVFPVHIKAVGRIGEPLQTRWTDLLTGQTTVINGTHPVEAALKRPLDREEVAAQLRKLGGTIFAAEQVEVDWPEGAMLRLSALNELRRDAVLALLAAREKPPEYVKSDDNGLSALTVIKPPHRVLDVEPSAVKNQPELTVLCRQMEQVRAALAHPVEWIYADFEFVKLYPEAVETVQTAGRKIALAVPRILMPGEQGLLRRILQLEPDGILIRNTGAMYFYMREMASLPAHCRKPLLIGDFSLNITNHLTATVFEQAGCSWWTPSYDLNVQQMVDLLAQADSTRVELVLHQHLPMFHTEHCVYCTFMSEGTDYTNCGRPCEDHRASLRDRVGMSHPVRVDEGCRNTVYNAVEQSGAEYLNEFLGLGVRRFRIEFLEETGSKVDEVLGLYLKALRGEVKGQTVWRQLKAINQLGVTRGQLVK